MSAAGPDKQPLLRPVHPGDLAAINDVIAHAIGTWDLSERTRRISVPLYQYHLTDLEFLQITVAIDNEGKIIGVAALEPASPGDTPADCRALLLHGIFVDPAYQGLGIGGQLLDQSTAIAADGNYDGLLVKAQTGAGGFFDAKGLERLSIQNPQRDYPHRYWLDLHKRTTLNAA